MASEADALISGTSSRRQKVRSHTRYCTRNGTSSQPSVPSQEPSLIWHSDLDSHPPLVSVGARCVCGWGGGGQLQSKDETNDGLYTDIITLEEAYVLVGHGWAQ